MSDFAIRTENLSKRYRIGQREPYKTLRDVLANTFFTSFRKQRNREPKDQHSPHFLPHSDYIWALKDVSLKIQQGEVVGVIGRNGSGKTTLLKILSRITEPTEGYAEVRGRVGSLLEVGTGFHPELTGRENIYLNGALLGMNEREIDSKFDEIVAFAEVDDFLDTPVKRYSSGMSMRLAFSVAAHLEPEILLVDEVLAVGDAAFQKKCLGKMGDVAQEGRTVLFVSHNMGAIRSLCGRAIWVNQGQIFMDGDPSQIISNYLSATVSQSGEGQIVWDNDFDAPGGEELKLRAIRLIGPEGKVLSLFEVEKPIHIEISYEVKKLLRGMRIHLSLLTPQGEVAFQSTDYKIRPEQVNPGYYRSVCTIPGELLNIGKYVVRVGGGIPGIKRLLPAREYLSFDTAGHGNQGSNYPERWPGVVCPRLDWRIEKTELESR